ncbi:MAG: GGDEF domain-containing protein [Proteobacteria bacterium]|jgi:diguanylate cyclase (GGDEF)-like protein|nr:GGDEF domain-containing protein [Desulfocapsa sp.]MBU3945740.1 GGDEF domain-containing protein [Pseudomonadota bacterium]MCG2743473.1 GGDEF domain-containing protein [Desulfobacteraceae bacterium]MBU4029556.1 GGDEF domain-containing protein [Pseudomonadota bacterium]MBU4043843.1 GGDEF domain-containing protein [Pseudomonadota bacterium]
MQNNLFIITIGLTVAGVFFLLKSLVPVRAIIQKLSAGNVRNRWKLLVSLIFMFILGYILYAFLRTPDSFNSISTLIVPGIFFSGAVFVFLVCSLSLKTALDLQRIYVLEQENITDPLTGLFNRRYLDRRIVEEFQRAMRFEQPFSVFLLDIDHFKNVNDTYGHQIGDMVLKKLGHLIMESVREVDVVIRYGGEEILVILPNTRIDNAFELAERLRKQIEETIIEAADSRKGQPAIHITVSIGVSEYQFSDGWDNAEKVLQRADKALYRAKDQGRNRVFSSEKQDEQC